MFRHRFKEFSEARVIIRVENVVFALVLLKRILLYTPLTTHSLVWLTITILRISLVRRHSRRFIYSSALSLTCGPYVVALGGYFAGVVDGAVWRSASVDGCFL